MSKKISQLPAGTVLTGSIVPFVEGGITQRTGAQAIGKLGVQNAINSGTIDLAPSQDAVYTALNLRLLAANNLSDVANTANARANLNITPANIGAATNTHQATHNTGGSDALTGNVDANARVAVRKNTGANTGTRRRLNFIEGSGMSISMADDSGNEEVAITITNVGGGAPSNAQYVTLALDGTLSAERALIASDSLSLTDTGANGNVSLAVQTIDKYHTRSIHFTMNSDSELPPATNGTQASIQDIPGQAGHPGIIELDTGTTAAGRSYKSTTALDEFLLSGTKFVYKTRFQLPSNLVQQASANALSDGTNTYTIRNGFLDSITGEPVDGVFFRYTHSENAGNWTCVCRQNNTETTANSGVAVALGSWVDLDIEPASSGTSVVFKINGSTVATMTTNIPNATGRETGLGFGIIKSVGTAARGFWMDYLSITSIH